MSLDIARESLEAPSTTKTSTENTLTPQRTTTEVSSVQDADMRAKLDRVLNSDIGVNTLLTRLKQSISSAREFSSFLKERAALEEKNAIGMGRLTRGTQEVLGRPENRQGSFAFNYRELGTVHEKMAKNSEEFAYQLLSMSEELQTLAADCERGRKQWKHMGLEAEQRAQDADSAMDKAKQRYYSLAEQYDRVRTGERQGGKFGIKGPKSAQQQEESMLSKAENAEQEYRSRVEAAQHQRHELLTSSRPQAIRELQNMVMECDAAVSMQLQKFAVLNEKLLLGNGLCVSPLKTQENGAASGSRSLREIAQAVNNQRDFDDFVLSHSGKVGVGPGEIRYEKHPALLSPRHPPPPGPNTFNSSSRSDTGYGAPPRNDAGYGPPPRNDNGYGPPLRNDTGFGPPPRSDTGFGAPNRSDTGFGAPNRSETGFGGPPRSDTGFGSMRGPMDQHGQTSSVVPNSPQHQQGPYSGPPGPTASNVPQLPQIGAISTGGKPNLDGSRSEPHQGNFDNDYRGYAGQPENRSGQPGYPEPVGYIPGTSAHHQVTNNYEQSNSGPGAGLAPGPGQGRGQVPTTGVITPQYGSPGQGSYSHHSRGTSLGQQNDFRSDGRGPQQGLGYQPQHQDVRGLPSQKNTYGSPTQGGLNNNNSPIGGALMSSRGPAGRTNLPPPLHPVFGIPLDELFRRDGAAVPTIVYQCIKAVDMYGLKLEGIYRVSGSSPHYIELQALFDHDSSLVDFRNRAAFYNDVPAVTTLLKHFLRDLPDPLLTSAQYGAFIQAAKYEDDVMRRDALHAIINSLPDPNYATLRTLILHLNRVVQNSAHNRMTANNLGIVFGPTLMGVHHAGAGGEFHDAALQAKVIETILNNTLLIFDDDD